MRQDQYGENALCVAAIGSMTMAIKAQRVLRAENIGAEIVALSANETRRGCAYGISFPLTERLRARTLLRGARIPVSEYFMKGGTNS